MVSLVSERPPAPRNLNPGAGQARVRGTPGIYRSAQLRSGWRRDSSLDAVIDEPLTCVHYRQVEPSAFGGLTSLSQVLGESACYCGSSQKNRCPSSGGLDLSLGHPSSYPIVRGYAISKGSGLLILTGHYVLLEKHKFNTPDARGKHDGDPEVANDQRPNFSGRPRANEHPTGETWLHRQK